MEKKQKKRRKLGWPFWIFFGIFVASISFGATYLIMIWKNSAIYGELQELSNTEDYNYIPDRHDPLPYVPPEPTPASDKTIEREDIPVDFQALWDINHDAYAWITIPDTVIDYPILQSSGNLDENYYLNHTIEYAGGFPGSLYTHTWNSRSFTDRNTIIYGHDMLNGTMFGELDKYRDPDYAEEHKYIYVFLPDKILIYEVFASVTFSDVLIPAEFDFSTNEGLQKYLDELAATRNMSTYFRDDITVTGNSRILTLSTCNGNDSQRYLVEAVLIDEQ